MFEDKDSGAKDLPGASLISGLPLLERLTRKEMALRRGRLGICVLVRAPAVPVFKDLPEAGEYAPL